ncbi:MAG TPA: penicillin-insensitive murein endopeptidase [Azospirillum sp.]|nr:penicillin-insensitive murein endopeptidase [Azospirillum sp.]
MLGGLLVAACALALMAGDADAKQRKARKHTQAAYNPIAWSRTEAPAPGPAQAIGGYAAGCLAGGVALPGEGTGYQVIRLSRHRNYGHPVLVDFLKSFGMKVATAGLGTALIADMGQARGGPMSYGHASHQSGLDADVWLRLDLPPMGRAARESLEEIKYVDYDRRRVTPEWSSRQAEMIRIAASDPRVARIFVSPAIKAALCRKAGGDDRDWLRKLRPWHGHDGHMHIRLSCPPGSPQCEEQRELPVGDGCGEEVHAWLGRAVPVKDTPPEKANPRNPHLPAACQAVLRSTGTRLASAAGTGIELGRNNN